MHAWCHPGGAKMLHAVKKDTNVYILLSIAFCKSCDFFQRDLKAQMLEGTHGTKQKGHLGVEAG